LKPNLLLPTASKLSVSDEEKIEEAIHKGMVLEQRQQWKEALSHYENAIRTYRKAPALMERFRNVRFHYDIDRRCEDASFENMMTKMSFVDALSLYDEIMLKIQMNHVDPPHWNEMFQHGLSDLEIALQNDLFRQKNQITAPKDEIASVFGQIRNASLTWNIDNPSILRSQMIRVIEFCQKEFAMNATSGMLEFLCGIANSLDPYTAFLTLSQYNDQMCMIRGSLPAGLGIEITADQYSTIITRVIPGSPAEQGGLKRGDRILVINGVGTEKLSIDQAANLLQGTVGSVAELQIQSGNTVPREVAVRYEQVKVLSVEDVRILDDYIGDIKVGYLHLTGFQQDTVLELQSALSKLHAQGMEYLILDLRNNPGGVLTEVIAAADLFINDGIIVRTRSRDSQEEAIHSANPNRATWNVPLIVLINEDSASASEIFAGAIQDNKRGIIIGKRSYGKDTVQAVYDLRGNYSKTPIAGLKLTIETFSSPNGNPYTGRGVEPDIISDNQPVASTTADGILYSAARPVVDGDGTVTGMPVLAEDQVIRAAVDEVQRQMKSASRPAQNKNR